MSNEKGSADSCLGFIGSVQHTPSLALQNSNHIEHLTLSSIMYNVHTTASPDPSATAVMFVYLNTSGVHRVLHKLNVHVHCR